MSSFTYHDTRTRDYDNPYTTDSPTYHPRSLIRRNSKRQRVDLFDDKNDDDEYDDYPYSSSHNKPSRALTIRQPTQLEKYNVWSSPKPAEHNRRGRRSHSYSYSDEEEDEHDASSVRYRYVTPRRSHSRHHSDDDDRADREYRLNVRATFSQPKSSHGSQKATHWPSDLFKRREKYEHERWETKEKDRRGNETAAFWENEQPALKEKTVRYRRIKRTRTDEWKPLSGWRRE
jgi:hypothetical protein